jgi:hypothetical protein
MSLPQLLPQLFITAVETVSTVSGLFCKSKPGFDLQLFSNNC